MTLGRWAALGKEVTPLDRVGRRVKRERVKAMEKLAQLLARAAVAARTEASPTLPSSQRQTTSTYSTQQSWRKS